MAEGSFSRAVRPRFEVSEAAGRNGARTIFRLFAKIGILALFAMLLAGGPFPAAAEPADFLEFPQLAASDTQDAGDEEGVNDPIEPVNRFIFGFNEGFLRYVLRPLTDVYDLLPGAVRNAVGNVLGNLSSPLILANDILQGEAERAMQTAGRFIINSTVGLAGIIDVAEMTGIPEHDEDLGQTMATWGMGEGFYLVLPILGPSNPRDAVGTFVESFVDPFDLWWANIDREYITYTRQGFKAIHTYYGFRNDLDEVRRTSIDYYAAIRSMYRQRRKSEIRNGEEMDLPPIPELSRDFKDEMNGQLPRHEDAGDRSSPKGDQASVE